MTRTQKYDKPIPREASRIVDVKADRERLQAFATRAQPSSEVKARLAFVTLKRKGLEF